MKLNSVIFLLCMGTDRLYSAMTLTVIDRLRNDIDSDIIVLCDEYNQKYNNYKNTKWINCYNKEFDQTANKLNKDSEIELDWTYCGYKILIFEIAKKFNYKSLIYLDSDIYIEEIVSLNILDKRISVDDTNVYMIPDTLFVQHDTQINNRTWCNGGFIATNVINEPDINKYKELLNKGYTDQDSFSILWSDKIYFLSYVGFTHLYTRQIKLYLTGINSHDIIFNDIMKKYIKLLNKHYIDKNNIVNDLRLSIVIPIYNDYDNLNRLFFNLSLQIFKNFNIILINDDEKIDYTNIINNYKNLNIHYLINDSTIHGPSKTRQIGLDYIINNNLTDWVTFIDSDDILTSDYAFKEFEQKLKENDIDYFRSGALERYGQNNENVQTFSTLGLKGNFYKIDIIKKYNIRFHKVYQFEDVLFDNIYKYYIKNSRIFYFPKPLVNYLYNENSITNTSGYVYKKINSKFSLLLIEEPIWRTLVTIQLNKLDNEYKLKDIFIRIKHSNNELNKNYKNLIKESDFNNINKLHNWLLGYLHKFDESINTISDFNFEYTETEINDIYNNLKIITNSRFNDRITLPIGEY